MISMRNCGLVESHLLDFILVPYSVQFRLLYLYQPSPMLPGYLTPFGKKKTFLFRLEFAEALTLFVFIRLLPSNAGNYATRKTKDELRHANNNYLLFYYLRLSCCSRYIFITIKLFTLLQDRF